MGKRGRGFGRRMVLDLDDSSQNSTNGQAYYGASQNASKSHKQGIPSGLVGYGDSEEESDGSDAAPTPPRVEEEDFQLEKEDTAQEEQKDTADKSQEAGEETAVEKPDSNGPTVSEPASGSGTPAAVEVKADTEQPATTAPPPPPVDRNDSMDTKLADFLAEIESIDMPTSGQSTPASSSAQPAKDTSDVDGVPMATEPPILPPLPPPEESSSESEEELPPLVKPMAPTTPWQHCLDEGTRCYYYWNTVSNEVTWAIPQDYSQYLLQLKEYEAQLAKYEAEVKRRQDQPKVKRKKSSKKAPKVTTAVEPSKKSDEAPKIDPAASALAAKFGSGEASGELELTGKPPVTGGNRSDYTKFISFVASKSGSDIPQIEESIPNTGDVSDTRPPKEAAPAKPCIGPELPPGMESLPVEGPSIGPQLPDASSAVTQNIIGPMLPANLGPAEKVPGPQLPKEDEDENRTSRHRRRRRHSSSSSSSRSRSRSRSPKHKSKKHKKRRRKRHSSDSSRSKSRSRSRSSNSDSDTKRDKRSSVKKVAESSSKGGVEEEEGEDVGLDDLDDLLEMALEKRKEELKELETSSSHHGKRKLDGGHESKKSKKKSKRSKGEAESDHDTRSSQHKETKKKLDKADIKRKAEIADLSTLVQDKLEFLEINRKGLSKLQILLVVIETRLVDWREGSLSTPYMLQKLQEAHKQLLQFESGAAPPGWSCNWDRTYRRYFYFNEETGETRWDYPDEPASQPLSPQPPTYPPPGQEAAHNLKKETYNGATDPTEGPPGESYTNGSSSRRSKHKKKHRSRDATESYSSQEVDPVSLASAPPPPPGHAPYMEYAAGVDYSAPPPPPPPHQPAIDYMSAPPPPPSMPQPVPAPSMPGDGLMPALPGDAVATLEDPDLDGVSMEMDEDIPEHVIRAAPVLNKPVTSAPSSGPSSPPAATQEPTPSQSESTENVSSTSTHHKEKKKKKDKKISGGLALKKKNFPSLVEKWQQIQHQVEKETKKQKRELME